MWPVVRVDSRPFLPARFVLNVHFASVIFAFQSQVNDDDDDDD